MAIRRNIYQNDVPNTPVMAIASIADITDTIVSDLTTMNICFVNFIFWGWVH